MSTQLTLSTAQVRDALLAGSESVVRARDELNALDAAAGDGDLGVTLATGFTAIEQLLAEQPGEDVGQLLTRVGIELGRAAPSTMGTLLATAFIRAGAVVHGHNQIGSSDIASMLEAAANGVRERGHVEPGQRSVLDAMAPAAEVARHAADNGLAPSLVLEQAASAAAEGAERTREMEPRVGRAGWIGDRVLGQLDGGAVAWAQLLEGLAARTRVARDVHTPTPGSDRSL
jgi:dihydroxyacetone kinase-like protein